MRHVEEPSVTTGNGGAIGAERDDITVITHLDDPAQRDRTPETGHDGEAGDLRDYAQLAPVVRATPRWMHQYTAGVVVADGFAALIAALIAITAFDSPVSPWVITLFPPAWVAALAMGRTYEHRFVGNGSEEYKRLFHTSVAFLAVIGTVAYAGDVELTRWVVVVGLPTAMVLSLVAHWVARQILHTQRRHERCMQQVVVV